MEPYSTTRGRRQPTRAQIVLRRAVALLVLVGGLGVGGWLAAAAIRADEEPSPPTTAAVKPRPKPLRIVFPEGFTRSEMARRITAVNAIARRKRKIRPRLSAKAYLAATRRSSVPGRYAGDGRARSLEGFLFPATYEFTAKTTSKQLVARQLEAFRRNLRKVDLRYARSKNLTQYDVVIIASLIEKETIAPEERPLVAAVIYNRLRLGMPLGIDASIRYALGVRGTEPLRQSHLASPTPYYTRQRAGLPPTPIANPGLASLRAAARPARNNYLYFVRKPDKVHHFFTASFAEFQRKAREYGYGAP